MATSGEEASVTDVSKTKAPGATEVSAAAEIAAAVASVVASAGVSTVASAVALRCTASTAGATHEAVRRGLRAAASRAAYCNNASGEAIHAENSAGNASARLSRAKAASSAISELTMPAAHAGNSSGVKHAGHAICSAAGRNRGRAPPHALSGAMWAGSPRNSVRKACRNSASNRLRHRYARGATP